jgi:hypothetical protein
MFLWLWIKICTDEKKYDVQLRAALRVFEH